MAAAQSSYNTVMLAETCGMSNHGLLESVGVLLEEVCDPLRGDRLGALQRQVERAVPEELRQHAVRAAEPEEYLRNRKPLVLSLL